MISLMKYAKFIMAVLAGATSVLTAATTAGGDGGADWRQVLVAAVGAGMVLLVPNKKDGPNG